ncbi:Site-specific tyrosine recombinase [hydrothermal vent metagenome]|uniref:Site-specific tyrosine recombinase n=1 Tax=hydrothermal vent metagenome TaxID=652676 RepID=A0A3B0YSJ5_9ZZZZ
MTQNTHTISPLRQRMIEDMRMRKLSPQTQTAYVRVVKNLTRFLGQPPDTASAEDLRRYQLYLVEQGTASGNLNAIITGLRFFFETTLEHPEIMKRMRHVYEPRKIPVILSLEEVTRLLQSAGGPKYQAALGVAYGAGLRANEIVHLTTTDIDSERMVIRVEQGKGKRDRYAMLSPALLELLRIWWRHAHAQRKMLPGGWLFPGQNPVNPMSTRQLARAFHLARKAAKIDKAVSLHSLRHAFATHLLEHHEDIRVIQVLLGHKKIENTARYSQVAAKLLREVKGPLEYLEFRPPV